MSSLFSRPSLRNLLYQRLVPKSKASVLSLSVEELSRSRSFSILSGAVNEVSKHPSASLLNIEDKSLSISTDLSDPPVQTCLLPNGRVFAYCISGPDSSKKPLIVAIHGSPGSHRDFRYFGGLTKDYRLLRIDMVGHGGSASFPIPEPHQANIAESVWSVLESLAAAEVISSEQLSNVVFLTHSMGVEPAVNAAALQLNRVKGIMALNPTGIEPHIAIRPPLLMTLLALPLRLPLIGTNLMTDLVHQFFMRVWGFPKRLSRAEVNFTQQRIANRDYPLLLRSCAALREHTQGIPVLLAYCIDDPLIEDAIATQLFSALTAIPFTTWTSIGSDALGKGRPERNRLIRFAKGGHMANKNQSQAIVPEMLDWLNRLQ